MDAPSLSPERSKELADLRRRAYGPDADIQRDPVAQRRLDELEELARAGAVDSASTGDEVVPPARGRPADASGRAGDGGDAAPADPAGGEQEAGAPVAAPSTARPWWRRIPLWSVTAIAGIAVGVGVGVVWSADSESSPDRTLGIESDSGERGTGFTANLDYWGIDAGSVVPHGAYDVIEVWTARAIDESRCLMLSHDGDFLSATCSGAGLDPILDFTVYEGMSLQLDEPLPEGTVIRFVGKVGEVEVWVNSPPQADDAAATTSRRDSAPSFA